MTESRSGRFILIKLWSPFSGGNIDIQSVVAHGFAGPRFFPSIELRELYIFLPFFQTPISGLSVLKGIFFFSVQVVPVDGRTHADDTSDDDKLIPRH